MYKDFYRGNVKVDQELIPGSTNPPSSEAVLEALETKVDKEEGKGLSSNDFTDEEKEKLQELEQVEIVDNLEEGGRDKALSAEQGKILNLEKVSSEPMGPVQQVPNQYYNKSQTDALLANKQNVIDDLTQLREKINISQYTFYGNVSEILTPREGYICVEERDDPFIVDISPETTVVSFQVPSKRLKVELDVASSVYVDNIYSITYQSAPGVTSTVYLNEGVVEFVLYSPTVILTLVEPDYFYYTSLSFYEVVNDVLEYNHGVWKTRFSGSYNDLSEKPLIPTRLSQLSEDEYHLVVTELEKASWNAKYIKPLLGIPKSDLTQEVQHLLDTIPSEEELNGFVEKVPDIPGHYAKFTNSGNIEDGGLPDTVPSDGSNNLITSGAVFNAIKPPQGSVNLQARVVTLLTFGSATVEMTQSFSVEGSPFVALSEVSSLPYILYYYQGSLSYSLDVNPAFYDVYFDRSDRFIRVRVYSDNHITTYWDYKIYSVLSV